MLSFLRAQPPQISLFIDPWEREPDTRSGAKPTSLRGALTATGLTAGSKCV